MRILSVFLIIVMLCITLSGCAFTGKDDHIHPDNGAIDKSEKEIVRYTYRVAYKDIEFATEQTKESWREPLLKLFQNEARRGRGEAKDEEGDYVFPVPDAPGVLFGYYIGLFDIDVDGVPELLIDMGGGSAGNSFYEVYDIRSGEKIGSVNGGQEDSWCVYFDTNTGDFEAVGQFQWRCGWMGKNRFINKADITHSRGGIEKCVYETEYLTAGYNIDVVAVDITQEDKENGIHGAWEEIYTGTIFNVNGNKVSVDSYFEELDRFTETYIRVPETAIKLITRSDYNTANEIVDALLSLKQEFIVPNQNS